MTDKIGFVIPEFPQQTHIAWWRVAATLRRLGVTVRMISTRRPDGRLRVHKALDVEARDTFYVWPPTLWPALARPGATLAGLRYLASLEESGLPEKLRLAPLLAAAAELRAFCAAEGIGRIFVHSCANAAHLAALCHEMGGPPYALRLGGDPEVYGKDHRAKMRKARFVLSASPTYFDQLEREAGVPRDRLLWAWAGVDVAAFSPTPPWPERPGGGPLRLITVARLNPVKGHVHVLNAMAALVAGGANATYTIVGGGANEAAIRDHATALGLADRVTLTGPQDAGAVAALLRAADVHVLASFGLGEAAPVAVCEAMAAGLPAVCTRIGATPLMVADGVDGFLVEQQDDAALAEALGRLAGDPARLVAMKRAARSKAEVEFDVTRTARTILEQFDRGA